MKLADTLDEFLKQFPGVSHEQAITALEEAKALALVKSLKPLPSGAT